MVHRSEGKIPVMKQLTKGYATDLVGVRMAI